MAEIILPPIPPRPTPAVRPTMVRELKEPGNKGTEVVMVKGPGTEPGPQPEPAKPLVVADGKGANWIGSNVYLIGQTVEGRTAEYEGGAEPVTYRYRFQTKATGSDTWVDQAWTNTTNAKNPVYFEITEAGQLKLQSQARDSSDPTVQLNSVTGIKTIQPQTTIGVISFLANGVKAPDNLFSTLVGSTLDVDCITTGGTATDQTYLWKIRNGDATFTGSTTNKTCNVQLGNVVGMVHLQCDVSSANSTNSPQSSILGVVVGESMKVANPQAY